MKNIHPSLIPQLLRDQAVNLNAFVYRVCRGDSKSAKWRESNSSCAELGKISTGTLSESELHHLRKLLLIPPNNRTKIDVNAIYDMLCSMGITLFSFLPPVIGCSLCKYAGVMDLNTGATLFTRGEPGCTYFAVLEGSLGRNTANPIGQTLGNTQLDGGKRVSSSDKTTRSAYTQDMNNHDISNDREDNKEASHEEELVETRPVEITPLIPTSAISDTTPSKAQGDSEALPNSSFPQLVKNKEDNRRRITLSSEAAPLHSSTTLPSFGFPESAAEDVAQTPSPTTLEPKPNQNKSQQVRFGVEKVEEEISEGSQTSIVPTPPVELPYGRKGVKAGRPRFTTINSSSTPHSSTGPSKPPATKAALDKLQRSCTVAVLDNEENNSSSSSSSFNSRYVNVSSWDVTELTSYFHRTGIVIDRWGAGDHLTVADLHRELQLRLCRLMDGTPPVRTLSEVLVRLHRAEDDAVLVQGMQTIPDGRCRSHVMFMRVRFNPLEEDAREAALSRIQTELGLRHADIKMVHDRPVVGYQEGESRNYPGLPTLRHVFRFSVVVRGLPSEPFETEHRGRRTVWMWVSGAEAAELELNQSSAGASELRKRQATVSSTVAVSGIRSSGGGGGGENAMIYSSGRGVGEEALFSVESGADYASDRRETQEERADAGKGGDKGATGKNGSRQARAGGKAKSSSRRSNRRRRARRTLSSASQKGLAPGRRFTVSASTPTVLLVVSRAAYNKVLDARGLALWRAKYKFLMSAIVGSEARLVGAGVEAGRGRGGGEDDQDSGEGGGGVQSLPLIADQDEGWGSTTTTPRNNPRSSGASLAVASGGGGAASTAPRPLGMNRAVRLISLLTVRAHLLGLQPGTTLTRQNGPIRDLFFLAGGELVQRIPPVSGRDGGIRGAAVLQQHGSADDHRTPIPDGTAEGGGGVHHLDSDTNTSSFLIKGMVGGLGARLVGPREQGTLHPPALIGDEAVLCDYKVRGNKRLVPFPPSDVFSFDVSVGEQEAGLVEVIHVRRSDFEQLIGPHEGAIHFLAESTAAQWKTRVLSNRQRGEHEQEGGAVGQDNPIFAQGAHEGGLVGIPQDCDKVEDEERANTIRGGARSPVGWHFPSLPPPASTKKAAPSTVLRSSRQSPLCLPALGSAMAQRGGREGGTRGVNHSQARKGEGGGGGGGGRGVDLPDLMHIKLVPHPPPQLAGSPTPSGRNGLAMKSPHHPGGIKSDQSTSRGVRQLGEEGSGCSVHEEDEELAGGIESWETRDYPSNVDEKEEGFPRAASTCSTSLRVREVSEVVSAKQDLLDLMEENKLVRKHVFGSSRVRGGGGQRGGGRKKLVTKKRKKLHRRHL